MSQVYIVVHKNKKGAGAIESVHSTEDAATAVAQALDNADVKTMTIDGGAAAPNGNKAKAAGNKRAKVEEADEEDEDEEMPDTAPAKKPAAKKGGKAADPNDPRKQIPEGKKDALSGMKVIFTGTWESMDRTTQENTAKQYGAKVIKKLEDVDYVFLGARPGDKKLAIIAEHQLETVGEEDFYELLKNGVPQDKIDAAAAKAAEGPAPKKQKK